MSLKVYLTNFLGSSNEETLTSQFVELAEKFLYGGYINVKGRYKIFIRTVEFYYHEENGTIKDPIVYHRNTFRDVNGKLPYYPPLTLHSHSSGFDIAFENEKEAIRSSVLIRAYEVYDIEEKCLWCWEINQGQGHFVKRNPLTTKGRLSYNVQSTYLKAFLNGFSLEKGGEIFWQDEQRDKNKVITQSTRQGVYLSSSKDIYKKTETKDPRMWSFRREDDIFS